MESRQGVIPWARALLPFGIALAALALFGAAFVTAGLAGWGTPAANEQAIGEVSRWCERVAPGLLREPVNTLANLGFVAVGLTIFGILARDERLGRRTVVSPEGSRTVGRFVGNTPTALLYAAAATFLGPGSMLMHGSHLRLGAWLDNASMVAYVLVPWLVNVVTLASWRDRRLFGTYVVLLAAYAAGYWFIGPDLGIGLDLFELSIALWIISEVLFRWWAPGPRSAALRAGSGLVGLALAGAFGLLPKIVADPAHYWWVALFWLPALLVRRPAGERRRYTPWFFLGFGAFFAAYAIWTTGTASNPLCAPDSPLQAHAIWHLLDAAAAGCFFVFLRTGRSTEPRPRPASG